MASRKIDLGKARRAVFDPGKRRWLPFGSTFRSLRALFKRRFRKTPADRLAILIKNHARARDWRRVEATAVEWAVKAEALNDRSLLQRVGYDLRRIKSYPRSFELIAKSDLAEGPKEWDGCDLRDKVLLIERRKGDLATFLLYIGVVELAMRHCLKCMVLIDERLEPLYRRTFPGLDLRIEHRDEAGALAEADCVTSFEMVAFRLKWDARQTVTLKPDSRLVEEFRSSYRQSFGDRKLVGIAWGSLNRNKSTPILSDWHRLMAGSSGQFVSLQYGNVVSAIASFQRKTKVGVFVDHSVDQLTDMDRFAAQIASLDAVVTISNTIAHTAGALGAKTVVLLDDRFSASWPAFGDDVPWYQKASLVRKSGRSWSATFDEARQLLSDLL